MNPKKHYQASNQIITTWVILDIKMPEMDGFALYKEIKEIDPIARACFLTAREFLSGSSYEILNQ